MIRRKCGIQKMMILFVVLGVVFGQIVFALADQSVSGTAPQPADKHFTSTAADAIPSGPDSGGQVMTDIHDIKPLVRYGMDPSLLRYAAYAFIGLVIIGLMIFFIRFITNRHKPSSEPLITLPPDELAFKRLSRFEDIDRWDGKEFYFELSQVFRGYVQQRYGIAALEMTTEEFLPQVKALPMETELFTGVKQLLYSSDPVKFAGTPADRGKMEDDLAFVRTFVNKTTPVPAVDVDGTA